MKIIKAVLFISVLATLLYAKSPFTLTGVKSYYPVVELHSEKIDKKYKKIVLDLLIEMSNELGVETKNFSSRSLTFLINYISVGDILALKVSLVLGEDVMRLDTKDEIFVLAYAKSRIFVVENIEEDLIYNVEDLLEEFAEQYREDQL